MTPLTSHHHSLATAVLGIALVLGGTGALAQPPGSTGRERLTPEQQQRLFPQWRQLTQQQTQGRIAILQAHQRCVAAAGSLAALKACQRQERQALVSQRLQQREAMRQLLQRNGITPPERRDRDGRRPRPETSLTLL